MNNEQFIAKIKGFDPTAEANDIEKNSIHDFHMDPIPNHSFYKLDAGLGTNMNKIKPDKGSEYEKYTWLKKMIDKKGDIIVGNENTTYHIIKQTTKDKNIIQIDEAKDTNPNTSVRGKANHLSDSVEGILVTPEYTAGVPYLFRFALDADGYRISKDPTGPHTRMGPPSLDDVSELDATYSNLKIMYYQIAENIHIPREKKEKWLQEKINKFGDIIVHKNSGTYYLYKIAIQPPIKNYIYTLRIKLTPILKNNKKEVLSIELTSDNWPTDNGNYRFYKGTYNLKKITDKLEQNKWKTDNDVAIKEYAAQVKALEKIGNIEVKPHRLAELNEIKTAAWYNAEWDSIAWINDSNPILQNKSNLVKVKDNKVMWFDKDDPNAKNKGVVCYGRKLDQNKLAQNKQNELFNFQMERIEQNIKDLQKYENVSKFNKEVYSRWNL